MPEVRGTFESHGVKLFETKGASKGEGIWTAALLLADFLVDSQPIREGDIVLELGAGCGLTGLVAARSMQQSPSHVYLTDNDEQTLVNLQRNVDANPARGDGSNITVTALDFNQPEAASSDIPKVDVVVAADVLYRCVAGM
eukprot:3100402-Pyramimonas_sp.AAC.2